MVLLKRQKAPAGYFPRDSYVITDCVDAVERRLFNVIDHGDDTAGERNILPGQAVRITRPVETFVMAAGNRCCQRDFGRLRLGQQGFAKPAMAAHLLAPLFAQGGVGEQVVGQADLTDIEQRRRDLQTLAKGLIAAHGMRQQGRHHPHAQHLARGAARAVLGA